MKNSAISEPRQALPAERGRGLPGQSHRSPDVARDELRAPQSSSPVLQLLTLSQVGERLQLGHTSVDLLVRQGKLRVVRFGRAVRVTQAALADCIASLETATQDSGSNRSVVEEIVSYQRQQRGSQVH